jgi:toxin-antitoxin system PIN domain toxin
LILPDVNVLLYAFRFDSREHERYREWLLKAINGDAAYGMSTHVLSSLIRIATNPRVFVKPSELGETVAFCEALLTPAQCQIVQPGPRHWNLYARLCTQAKATGNLSQDAWFAAMAMEWGCEWITEDRDYARFSGLRWRPPFED